MMVPANWGHVGEPKTGIPACVTCGTEFWMDVDGYVEWYTRSPQRCLVRTVGSSTWYGTIRMIGRLSTRPVRA